MESKVCISYVFVPNLEPNCCSILLHLPQVLFSPHSLWVLSAVLNVRNLLSTEAIWPKTLDGCSLHFYFSYHKVLIDIFFSYLSILAREPMEYSHPWTGGGDGRPTMYYSWTRLMVEKPMREAGWLHGLGGSPIDEPIYLVPVAEGQISRDSSELRIDFVSPCNLVHQEPRSTRTDASDLVGGFIVLWLNPADVLRSWRISYGWSWLSMDIAFH